MNLTLENFISCSRGKYRHLVLCRGAVGDVVERDLEGIVLSNFELKDRAVEVGSTPIPALHAQLLVQHLQVVAAAEVFRHPVPFRLFKAGKSKKISKSDTAVCDVK